MSIRIDQEDAVIIGGILGPISRRTIVAPAMGEADCVKASNRLNIGSGEADMETVARSDGLCLIVRRVYHEELSGCGAKQMKSGFSKRRAAPIVARRAS
jgi:hypothetical protein